MNNYSLLVKSGLMIYTAYSYFSGLFDHAALLIIVLLFLAALSFLIPVFIKTGIRVLFIGLSIIIVCIFFHMFPVLILFIPILTLELLSLFDLGFPISCPIIFLGTPFAFQYGLEALFFLNAVFSCILLLQSRKERTIAILEDHNRELRLKNKTLLQRIEYHEELRHQLTYTAQLEERNRIAQELHDKIGHSLSGSLMQLEAIKVVSEGDPSRASSMLQTVIDTLRKGLDNIRITLRNTKPPAEQMGINRLQLVLDEFKEKNSIKTSITYEGDISRITPVLWKIFIDNAIEALTNMLRHTKADSVNMSIHVMNRIIRFQIKDNGPAGAHVKKGLGLAGMEERLLIVNGSLIIDNSDGFCITMLVPDEGDKIADKSSAG